MRRAFSAFCFVLVLVVAGFATGIPTGAGPSRAYAQGVSTVLDVRVGDHGDKTRFVVEMTAPLDFRIFSQTSPDRLIIDFPPLDWRAAGAVGRGVGLIAAHSYTVSDSGAGRVVLDLAAPARVRDAFFLPANGSTPFRFVVDLEPTDAARFAGQVFTPGGFADPLPAASASVDPVAGSGIVATPASARMPFPAPLPRARGNAVAGAGIQAAAAMVPFPELPIPRMKPEPLPIRVIAIDAGHGGIDPGAISVNGVYEKNITLRYARALRDALRATGRYRVFMTRDSDIYLKLRERVALARQAEADLFISIHADSVGNPGIRGASVYTLSETASDKEAELLAARENRADALAGVQLDPEDDVTASILIDLAQRLSQNEGKAFAQRLVASLENETTMLRNAHRQAGFAVLKAPDVPSVLIELGYLSNASDEHRLRSSDHQARIVGGIVRAIDDYFGWLDGESR